MRDWLAWLQRHPVFACLLVAAAVATPGYFALDVAVDRAQGAADTAQTAADKAQDAIDAVNQSRSESQVSGCNFAVDTARKINGLNDRTQDLLRTILAGSTDAQASEFLEVQIGLYEAVKVPYRDCTDDGIREFVDTGGVAGFLPPGVQPP